jgi:hypothetical protein
MTALQHAHLRDPAARFALVLQNRFARRKEGAGNAGCLLHPRSRVQYVHKNTHTSIQVQSEHSGIPCTMVLRLMPRSPRRRIRLVTVISELPVLPRPVGPTKTSADLTPATGARTTRFCRTQPAFAKETSPVSARPPQFSQSRGTSAGRLRAASSLTGEPALRRRCAPDAAASTASHPNVRDDGQRPSAGQDGASV